VGVAFALCTHRDKDLQGRRFLVAVLSSIHV
jgi:hypothetical protein